MEKGLYQEIRGLQFLSELIEMQEELQQKQSKILLCSNCRNLQISKSEDTKQEVIEALHKLPCLMILYGDSLQAVDLEVLLQFDLRVSEDGIYQMTQMNENWIPRFRLLAGDKETRKMLRCIEAGEVYTLGCSLIAKISNRTEQKSIEAYMERIFGDKSVFQNDAIVSCFVKARSNMEEASKEESIQFYRLIKQNMRKPEHETRLF